MQASPPVDNQSPKTPFSRYIKLILPFALGYLVSYLFRIVNAVAAPAILKDIDLSASELGLISSAYFIAFAAFQIPLGALLDRYQPHVITSRLLLIAAVGAAVFSMSTGMTGLLIGRALIGLGVSACLMAAFKAFVIKLPTDQLPFANGMQLAAGGLGALLATTPSALALEALGWRGLFMGLAILTVVASVVIRYRVPSFDLTPPSGATAQPSFKAAMKGTSAVFKSPLFLSIVPFSVLSQASFASIQGLWAGPWLQQGVGLNSQHLSELLFYSSFGMMLGFLTLGKLSTWLQIRGISTITLSQIGAWLFIGIQATLFLVPSLNQSWLWLLFGFFGTSGTLVFAGLVTHYPKHNSGMVTTSYNLLIFVMSFALQWGMGAIINLWGKNSLDQYPLDAFQTAFLCVIGLQIVAALWAHGSVRFKRFTVKPS
jgi:MFS family permease